MIFFTFRFLRILFQTQKSEHIKFDDQQLLWAVPTIVIAHTFCASRDTRVFLSVMLSNTVIFLCALKLSVERRSEGPWFKFEEF